MVATADKIKHIAEETIKQIKAGEKPSFSLSVRGLSNTEVDKRTGVVSLGNKMQKRHFFHASSAKSYMQTFMVLEKCKELLESGKTTSIRDLYYMLKHTIPNTREETFADQTQSDAIVEDIEVLLGELRENFGLFASSRGAMVGELTIVDNGDTIDLRRQGSGGWAIPSIVEPDIIKLDGRRCSAKFVLVVEKDASFRRLNEDKFWRNNKCLLVHGQGMPPRGARRLIYRLHNELRLPIYVLTDNDPWGIYIYSVIRSGSMNLAFESERMAVPKAKWLGIRSSDYKTYKLPPTCTIKLDTKDLAKLKQMSQYEWFASKKHWLDEFRTMKQNGFKLEIEALASKGLSFLSEYLKSKIKKHDWLN